MRIIRRGEIYWLKLDDKPRGSVQANTRPCIIVQNDKGNIYSTVTIVVVATRTIKEKGYPCDVIVTDPSCGLDVPFRVMCNQIFTIPIDELEGKIGKMPEQIMEKIDIALKNALSLK
ncbi:MAG: type II toxin-antitoxin system PemK/MazF family toxin [Candidatus Aenigmarchaeota archaeon]|nr:type II toxin-antitoxin system PemK/MazF family toxin [Candidatus Aenigmarchaeota archaeon]